MKTKKRKKQKTNGKEDENMLRFVLDYLYNPSGPLDLGSVSNTGRPHSVPLLVWYEVIEVACSCQRCACGRAGVKAGVCACVRARSVQTPFSTGVLDADLSGRP